MRLSGGGGVPGGGKGGGKRAWPAWGPLLLCAVRYCEKRVEGLRGALLL